VASGVPFAVTCDCDVNPAPLSVTTVAVAGTYAALPGIPNAAGEIELSCGAGFEIVRLAETVFVVSATLVT
jgi:hypothetical protein